MSTDAHAHKGLEGAYDPQLPFLEALEHEIRLNAERAARKLQAHGEAGALRSRAHASGPSHGGRVRRRGGAGLAGMSRMSRRSLTLVALLCLIGATAFGAREILSSGESNPAIVHQGPSVLVAGGQAGSERWSLRMYRREAALCSELIVAETEASRCSSAPRPRSMTVTSVVSPLRRYVFGAAGADVERVSVRVGSSERLASTHAPPPSRVRAAGLPAGARWFVATLSRPASGSDPPARARAVGDGGRVIGQPQTSCVETTKSVPCGR